MAAKGFQKDTIYIAVAVICGVIGVYMVRDYVDEKINAYRSRLVNTQAVLMANRNIAAGEALTENMLQAIPVPREFVHPRAIKKEDLRKILGNPVMTPVENGEVLLWNQMDMGVSVSVSEKIPGGHKAVTLPVTPITGAAGLLRANMNVDLYLTAAILRPSVAEEDRGRTDLYVTKLFENVTIVAVGDDAALDTGLGGLLQQGKRNYNTITVLVESKDVERSLMALEMAQTQGTKIYCVLRSLDDTGEKGKAGKPMSQNDFLGSLSINPSN